MMRTTRCRRCGNKTSGLREGGAEYCTTCGGVLVDGENLWWEEDAERFNELSRSCTPIGNYTPESVRNLTPAQRQRRQNLRNAYLVADIEELEAGKSRQDDFGKGVLQEMIDECRKYGVDNYGETPF